MTVGHPATSLGLTHAGGTRTLAVNSGTYSERLGLSLPQPNVSVEASGMSIGSPSGAVAAT